MCLICNRFVSVGTAWCNIEINVQCFFRVFYTILFQHSIQTTNKDIFYYFGFGWPAKYLLILFSTKPIDRHDDHQMFITHLSHSSGLGVRSSVLAFLCRAAFLQAPPTWGSLTLKKLPIGGNVSSEFGLFVYVCPATGWWTTQDVPRLHSPQSKMRKAYRPP